MLLNAGRSALFLLVPAAAAFAAGCGGGGAAGGTPAIVAGPAFSPAPAFPKHVVIIVQENRSFENLFHGFPGADTVDSGVDSHGNRVALSPVSLDVNWDIGHTHEVFVGEYNGGAMNGWDRAPLLCFARGARCVPPLTPFAYVPPTQVAPYWQLAQHFALADHVLQTNEGSSFSAHQYLIAGQSGGGDADHLAMIDSPNVPTGGCNIPHARIHTLEMTQPYPGVEGAPIFPCLDYATIFDHMAAKGLTWRYYTPLFVDIWSAPIAVSHIWHSPAATNIVKPETQIFSDIQNHTLPNLAYVIPRLSLSDHSGWTTLAGPDWVGTIVNAIGNDRRYWNDTAVFVVWDDWGGWFDHYAPSHPPDSPRDPYEYGFRVPLIAVSPYVRRRGFVDHTPRDMTALLGFVEHVFGLPSLGQRDGTTDDLFSMFDFSSGAPLPYAPVDTHGYTPARFRALPLDERKVDD